MYVASAVGSPEELNLAIYLRSNGSSRFQILVSGIMCRDRMVFTLETKGKGNSKWKGEKKTRT